MRRFILSPLTWYVVALTAFTVQDWVLAQQGLGIGGAAAALRTYVCLYLLMTWVCFDALRRRVAFPCDFVVLFFWLCFPIYLIHSRGWRGIGLLALIVLIPLALRVILIAT